ncbi:MAG: helix-turn-helix domain-containing protein [Acidobacteria bacterium]|nr:helix-turn-helix domain-containing protein [Acidobacteriota bacterium]
MSETNNNQSPYINVVMKALDVLDVFRRQEDELSLTEIAMRANLSPSYAYRLLQTLEHKGWVRRLPGTKKYHRINRTQRYRVGFAMQWGRLEFSREVLRSLEEAAERHGVHLIVADNENDEAMALRNAEMFVRQGVDFVIEFQVNERIAHVIGHKFAEAKIPCLAIDIPQPGAVFFGADNYRAGLLAGRALGEYARTHWKGKVDQLLLLELSQAGPLPQARLTGTLYGLQEIVGPLPESKITYVPSLGTLEEGARIARTELAKLPISDRVLIASVTDPCAVGVAQTCPLVKRTRKNTAIVGQAGTLAARTELARPNSCLIGSVGFFPEKYGAQIIPLVLKILAGEATPPTAHIQHVYLHAENLATYYPAQESASSSAVSTLPGTTAKLK